MITTWTLGRPPETVDGDHREWWIGSWAELPAALAELRGWVYGLRCALRQADHLLLVLLELVDNAMRHAGPPVELRIDADRQRWVIRITDRSTRPPRLRPRAGGLTLVRALADAGGWSVTAPGKIVWAVLDLIRPEAPGRGPG